MTRSHRLVVPLILAVLLIAATHLASTPVLSVGPARRNIVPRSGDDITGVDPDHAANDLDTPIAIDGDGFAATPAVRLGAHELDDVGWVDASTLTATVPWGLTPGVYTLTVANPGGVTMTLASAFTVTEGIGVWQAGELYGGELEVLAINPLTPTTLYGSSEAVGLFRTRDGGEHWDFVYAPGASAVAVDPVQPTTLYWGSQGQLRRSDDEGESWTRLTSALGQKAYPHPTASGTLFVGELHEAPGLWRSTDYGATWVTPTTGLTDTVVTDLVFHPTDPMTVVLGTSSGNLFVSQDGGLSWAFAAKPVANAQTLAFGPGGDLWVSDCCFCVPQKTYRSTDSGFTSFTEVLAAPLRGIGFAPLSWGAAYSRTVYAAGCWADAFVSSDGGDTWSDWGPETGGWGWGLALDTQTAGTIYKSSQQHSVYKTVDGGATWQVKNQGVTAMAPDALATVQSHPATVFGIVDGWGGVFRSTDGAASWQFLEMPHVDATPHSLLVDPDVPTRVYLGGNQAVHRSDDSGETWTVTGTLVAPPACTINVQMVSPDAFAAAPGQPGALLAGTNVLCNDFDLWAGAIYTSGDAGVTWSQAAVSRPISQVLDLVYDPVSPTVAFAATADTGMLRSTDGGASWQATGAGIAALDRVNSLTAEAQAPYRVLALTDGPNRDGLYATADHGETWTQVLYFLFGDQVLWVPETPPALYAATKYGLRKSSDGGILWDWAAGDIGRVPVYALASVATADRAMLYAGTTGGRVDPAVAVAATDAAATLVKAGVHRFTVLRGYEVFLPLVIRH